MLNQTYDELKTWMERLEREAPTLLSLGCAPSAASVDGVLNQAVVAKGHGDPACLLFIGRLAEDMPNGFGIYRFAVEPKHAINLIKTIKSRKK